MVGESGQSWLKKTPLFVSHERISKTAHEMGFEDVISTDSGDEGLIKGLLDYFGPRVRDGVYSQEMP
jgi:uroporphyrinogen-III synthase